MAKSCTRAEAQLAELCEQIGLLERAVEELCAAQEETTAAYDRAVRKLVHRAEQRYWLAAMPAEGSC